MNSTPELTALTKLMRTESLNYNELLAYLLEQQDDALLFHLIKEKETFIIMENQLIPKGDIKVFDDNKVTGV